MPEGSTRVTAFVVSSDRSLTVTAGPALAPASFQDQAHSSTLGEFVDLRRASSTEPLEERLAGGFESPEPQPPQVPAPAPTSTPK